MPGFEVGVIRLHLVQLGEGGVVVILFEPAPVFARNLEIGVDRNARHRVHHPEFPFAANRQLAAILVGQHRPDLTRAKGIQQASQAKGRHQVKFIQAEAPVFFGLDRQRIAGLRQL